MRPEDVKQYTRHWVEVYMGRDLWPSYIGMFLPGDGTTFSVVRGEETDNARPTPDRVRPPVSEIGKINPLGDPPWLMASNKAASVMSARAILHRAKAEGTDIEADG
jgi:hypothetical protein